MSRLIKNSKKLGRVILCIGAGLILAVLVPFWGWILAVGAALIVCGWNMIQNSGHR